jgi:hypothetical protein
MQMTSQKQYMQRFRHIMNAAQQKPTSSIARYGPGSRTSSSDFPLQTRWRNFEVMFCQEGRRSNPVISIPSAGSLGKVRHRFMPTPMSCVPVTSRRAIPRNPNFSIHAASSFRCPGGLNMELKIANINQTMSMLTARVMK